MAEDEPISIELEGLKRSYLRNLETGEPPTLLDLLTQADPKFVDTFRSFVVQVYFKTGKIGSIPNVDLQERADNLVDDLSSLSPIERRMLAWVISSDKPFPHLVEDETP
ncbi:MAG: hypothetical protein Q7R49_01370 [Candidatus Daviesbacteria bacterium]|nr:hypothetical protein [Candidatus Daviesbacteria bacterium]